MAGRGLVMAALIALSLGLATLTRATPSFFSTSEMLTLRLEGPFNELFTRVARNQKEIDPSSAVTGKLTVTQNGRDLPIDGVQIAVRGHTSRRPGECPFP